MRDIGRRGVLALRRLLRSESGAAAVEYGLIAAGLFVAIANVIHNVGANLSDALSLLAHAAN